MVALDDELQRVNDPRIVKAKSWETEPAALTHVRVVTVPPPGQQARAHLYARMIGT